MKSLIMTMAALATLAAGPAFAQYTPGQYTSPYARPPVSPYINLLRPGTNPAINYYGLVRPQVNMYNSLRNLQQQQAASVPNPNEMQQGPQEIVTGHHASFMTDSRYFLNDAGYGAGGGTLGRGGLGRGGYGGLAGRSGLMGGSALGGVGTTYPGAGLRR